MNLLLKLSDWRFAAAGLALAMVPLLLHFFHRRRYRTVPWAAMSFLRTAMQHQQHAVKMKNLLLMLLRMLALFCLGTALSRPYWSASGKAFDPSQPLHAILILDNSMSMSYEEPQGSLLQQAKDRVKSFIQDLPKGSSFTVSPLCGPKDLFPVDPIRSKKYAQEIIDTIESVDRTGSVSLAIEIAKEASERTPSLAKRVIFIGDQQLTNWQGDIKEQLKEIDDLQFVQVAPKIPENSWIADFQLIDAIVSTSSEASFVVRIGHQGPTTRRDVRLTLSLGEKLQETVTRRVDLKPGELTEVLLSCFWGNSHSISNSLKYLPAEVSLSSDIHDRIVRDNHRFLSVPAVKSFPIVFVDQYGRDERPQENRYGETFPLRLLLSPSIRSSEVSDGSFDVRHIRFEELSQSMIEDARLVVIAGVSDPSEHVELLREYIQQGGQLLILAGGEFHPKSWNDSAWRSGQGILPLPLQEDLLGGLPDNAKSNLEVIFIDYNSLKDDDLFRFAGTTDQQMADLYREPLFFQIVKITDTQEIRNQIFTSDFAHGGIEFENVKKTKVDRQRRNPLKISARQSIPLENQDDRQSKAEELSDGRSQPQILARYNNGMPFLVRRKIGQGRVLFATSGLFSDWNTLAKTNAIVLFHRVIQEMVSSNIPKRNHLTKTQRINIPVENEGPDVSYRLKRPDEGIPKERLQYGYISPTSSGIVIKDPHKSGIYQVTAHRLQNDDVEPSSFNQLRSLPVAVNHSLSSLNEGSESEMKFLTAEQFKSFDESDSHRWLSGSDGIRKEGSQVLGQDSWQFLLVFVFCVLLFELVILGNNSLRQAGMNKSRE